MTVKGDNEMNKMEKDQIQDQLSKVLTNYENCEYCGQEDHEEPQGCDCVDNLYDMLVKIQNNWGELTND